MSDQPPKEPQQETTSNDPDVIPPGIEQNEPHSEILMMAEAIRMRSGPLPEGEEIEKYEQTLPGAADRIVSMAEAEGPHRRQLESRGLYAGIASVFAGLIGGFALIVLGYGYLGILFAVVATAFPLISTFLRDRRR